MKSLTLSTARMRHIVWTWETGCKICVADKRVGKFIVVVELCSCNIKATRQRTRKLQRGSPEVACWGLERSGCQTAAFRCAHTPHSIKQQGGLVAKPPRWSFFLFFFFRLRFTPVTLGLVCGNRPTTLQTKFMSLDQPSNCRWWHYHPPTSTKTLNTHNKKFKPTLLSQVLDLRVRLMCTQRNDFCTCHLQQWLPNPGWQVHIWKLYTAWTASNQAHLSLDHTDAWHGSITVSGLHPRHHALVQRRCACYCALAI